MNIYFGDLHNHCGISYGYGSLKNALTAAKQHLDFCAVTGHALWPDMFERNEDTAFIIDFHKKGFEKLEKNWENIKACIAAANEDGKFVTLQSFEMHSSQFGDHHILSPSDELRLVKGNSPKEIISKITCEAIAIPHHIAYTPGYRGINWEHFDQSMSPVVEIYSKHGCGLDDIACEPYLHTMGPADGRNTARLGLVNGGKFGFVGSTDHHAGYPGSYGDGLTAVVAPELSRKAIWEAIKNRRTYAITGDRIKCDFSVNEEAFGRESETADNNNIVFEVEACDFIEKAVVYKNFEAVHAIHFEDFKKSKFTSGRCKVRVETGWGRKNQPYRWNMSLSINKGKIKSIEKCFRGRSVLAPREDKSYLDDINEIENKVLCKHSDSVEWICTTFKNPTTRHSGTCSIIFELEAEPNTIMEIEANGITKTILLSEILQRSESFHMHEYNSEACLIHRAVPENMYKIETATIQKARPGDFFHGVIKQLNGQTAWLSPVFMK